MNDSDAVIKRLTEEIYLLRTNIRTHKDSIHRLALANERLQNVIDEVENRLDEADEFGDDIDTHDVRGWINGARDV